MRGKSDSPFAARALEAFPHLLTEMIRAGARDAALLEEGFKYGEIKAVRALLTGAGDGLEPVDAELRDASRSSSATITSAHAAISGLEGVAVTRAGAP